MGEIIDYADGESSHAIDEPDWEPQRYLDGSVLLRTICR